MTLLLQALAASADETNWSLNAGLQIWDHTWQTGIAVLKPKSGNDDVVMVTSDRKNVPIGSANLRYKELVVSGSYFKRTEYSFPDIFVSGLQFRTEIARSEYDVDLGWLVIPELALAVGYKSVQFTYKSSNIDVIDGDRRSYDVFTLGIKGRATLSRGFGMYGNFAAGPAKAKYSGGGSDEGSYAAADVGFSYTLTKKLAATLGYKTELLSLNVGRFKNRDTMGGFLAGLNYTFF